MARPAKKRRVCEKPLCNRFMPQLEHQFIEIVTLGIDEYECIRLIDYEGMTQEECAEQMNLVRTSITGIYANARKKVADSLVNGKELRIEGGNYEFCHGNLTCCRQRMQSGNQCLGKMSEEWRKMKMVIAVTYEDGQVFQHFGHSEYFKIYEVDGGKVLKSEVVDTNGQGHEALADFLSDYSVQKFAFMNSAPSKKFQALVTAQSTMRNKCLTYTYPYQWQKTPNYLSVDC